MYFKLVHWRLGAGGWKSLGAGLGQSQSLRTFSIHGTNIGQINKDNNCENMQNLLAGMVHNQSLETLNFSDNDLKDDNPHVQDASQYIL